ncbi:MAG: hypothetical protein M4579_006026 [Chaenotheca gracillima]|nr:MAG: hypothetical protein M4579_006026 [Chaenotheca gracillima]
MTALTKTGSSGTISIHDPYLHRRFSPAKILQQPAFVASTRPSRSLRHRRPVYLFIFNSPLQVTIAFSDPPRLFALIRSSSRTYHQPPGRPRQHIVTLYHHPLKK